MYDMKVCVMCLRLREREREWESVSDIIRYFFILITFDAKLRFCAKNAS